MTDLQKQLFKLSDSEYREFHAKLMLTIDKEKIIGVRTPRLRNCAKEIIKRGDYDGFLNELPHRYYEENNLHAIILSSIDDYDETVSRLNAFLPYIDNWATCDIISPKAFKNSPKALADTALSWVDSKAEYTARLGIEMLMKYFLKDNFESRFAEAVAAKDSKLYYVEMMQAWYFATALHYRFQEALPFIAERRLPPSVHKKAIRKAIESYRISDEQKAILKAMR